MLGKILSRQVPTISVCSQPDEIGSRWSGSYLGGIANLEEPSSSIEDYSRSNVSLADPRLLLTDGRLCHDGNRFNYKIGNIWRSNFVQNLVQNRFPCLRRQRRKKLSPTPQLALAARLSFESIN